MAAGTQPGSPLIPPVQPHARILQADDLGKLIDLLWRSGYEVIGPTVRDGAIFYDEIKSISDLPRGWSDEQQPGSYRLQQRDDKAFFAYVAAPQSWKRYLHPADVRLFAAERQASAFRILNNDAAPRRPYAFLGVRACELAAVKLQDRVLLEGRYLDPTYERLRQDVLTVVVQCTRSAATCFCSSVGTGPRVQSGFDLSITELVKSRGHRFLVEVGSSRGSKILSELETKPASEEDIREADAAVAAAGQQVRSIDVSGIKDLLYHSFEHPHWDNLETRCLACANCTMVCPTCFCTTVEDVSDVTGEHAERWRRWDSCFTLHFSYIHGGSVRSSGKARYRQWITHKLASWIDQFGTPGCVGCGRCITWCPVGIDITEEIRVLRRSNHGNA